MFFIYTKKEVKEMLNILVEANNKMANTIDDIVKHMDGGFKQVNGAIDDINERLSKPQIDIHSVEVVTKKN